MPGNGQSKLIHRAKSGSSEALGDAFDLYGERLLALIRFRLGSSLRPRFESRDVLQETLIRAFRKIDQFEGSKERSLMAWMGVIANNVIRDEVSRIELKQRSQHLEVALAQLTEDRREVIVLRRLEESTFPEIAERTGKSADACRAMHSRAMAELAIRMRDLDRDEAAARAPRAEPP